MQDKGENKTRQSLGSQAVGTHFMPAMIIRVVPCDARHPGLSPGWHNHTHSGYAWHNHQKWAVGLKHVYMEASKGPFTRVQYTGPSRQRQGCRFLLSSEQSPGGQRHTVTALDHPWGQVEPPVQPERPLQRCQDPFLLGCFIFHIRKQSKGAPAAPESGHRTAGDRPLAKKDTLLSCILYW